MITTFFVALLLCQSASAFTDRVRYTYDKLMFYYDKHYLPQSEFDKHYWASQYHGIEKETPHTWELYDLRNDPQELHNRYNDPAYKEIIAELKEELQKQRIELNETDANYPEIQAIVEKHWND